MSSVTNHFIEFNSDSEPDGVLAVPPEFSENFIYTNNKGTSIFAFENVEYDSDAGNENTDMDTGSTYKQAKLLVPLILTRVVSQIMCGFNVFVRLEQKYVEPGQNVSKIIFTDEWVGFDLSENDEDTCWEVNTDVFHQI